jgi:hypothetical protein
MPCLVVLIEPRIEVKILRTLSSTSYLKRRPGGNRDLEKFDLGAAY